MDKDRINTLAREYAEEVYRTAHKEMEVLSNCLSNEVINMFAEDMKNKLKWLLHRFYLVEKSKVEDAYQSARKDIRDGYKSKVGGMIAIGGAKGALLESLFPELAKEVEG